MILKKIKFLLMAILKTKLLISLFLLTIFFHSGNFVWFNYLPESTITLQESFFLYYFLSSLIGLIIWFLGALALLISVYTYSEVKKNYMNYFNSSKKCKT